MQKDFNRIKYGYFSVFIKPNQFRSSLNIRIDEILRCKLRELYRASGKII